MEGFAKYSTLLFSILLFIFLLSFLRYTHTYYFFALEQNELFVYSWHYYIKGELMQPGGLSQLIGSFMTQFFIFPFAGPAITAGLFTLIWYMTVLICRRITKGTISFLPAFIPVFFLIIIQLDYNYMIQGSVAYLLMLFALYIYTHIAKFNSRILAGLIIIPFLFWWAGSITSLFAVCIVLWEMFCRPPKAYTIVLIVAEVLLISFGSVYFTFLGEYRFAFLPDLYYSQEINPSLTLYYAWVALPLILLLMWLLRRWDPQKKITLFILYTLQVACIVLLTRQGILMSIDWESAYLMKYDYHTRKHQWDRIISSLQGPQDDYLSMCYLNMALAQKGLLAEKAFHFDQKGNEGLIIPWNQTIATSTLLSDVYFTIGNTGMSQAMAFENNINSYFNGKPRMIQRLVQTNLIYGAWTVAERYLNILENTLFYKEWAKEHRKFLHNDELVNNDPLLGSKRKDLIAKNHLSGPWDIRIDLHAIASHNPQNTIAVEYLGMAYLLSRNLTGFNDYLHMYYSPTENMHLPASFQEAFLLIYEEDPLKLQEYNISESIMNRFKEYRVFFEQNQNTPAFAQMAYRSYGDTYWFYNFFKR